MFVVVALTGAGGAVWFMRQIANIDRYQDLEVDAVAKGDPSNYLVVGSDTREGSEGEYGSVGGRRSDTIMIVRIDPGTKQAAVLSLPRDLLVDIPGQEGRQRINGAYSESRQLLIDAIRSNFGIEVNHYVEVDFNGFRRLVDAVGGIPIQIDQALRDDDSGLYVTDLGCVTLNGDQALAYARSRHLRYMTEDGWSRQDPRADLGRIERQQLFIRIAVSHVLSQIKSNRNPLQITELVSLGTQSVGVDEQTDPLALANEFQDFSLDDLASYSLPVEDTGDGATVEMLPRQAEPILNIFRGLDPGEVSPGFITVEVLNGTDIDGLANNAAGAFQAIGFTIGERGDYPEKPLERTTVFHRPDEANLGERVARHISDGADLAVRDDLAPGTVVVAVGLDFTTVHVEPAPVEEEDATTETTEVTGGAGAPADDGGGGDGEDQAEDTPSTTAPTVPPTTVSEYTLGAPC
jgi:LCP family protein required for cell wall assembly